MNILNRLVADMQLMFRRPTRMQYAALCHRRREGSDALEILLITSRDTGRWVIPKGWPMEGRTAAEAAAQEAFEEAGVKGTVEDDMIGTYQYQKGLDHGVKVPCVVAVHPLLVSQMVSKFKEKGKRRLEWVTPEEAVNRVEEPELKALIRKFAADAPLAPSPATPSRKSTKAA
ncbi:NUDIX hydrolase [Rhizobium sp. SG2393]|uniref:NUDIX hydrolase n=1 Tax=Rhizobium sp. SG2393 TaxID=3276279 RepID=UPI00366CEA2B